MVDSKGRSGGSTPVLNVKDSEDNSCFHSDSPSSTLYPTQTQTSSQTSSQTYLPTHQSSHSSSYSVIGPAVGGAVGFVLLVAVAFRFLPICRRIRRHGRRGERPLSFISGPPEADALNGVELYHGSASQANFPNDSVPRPYFLDHAPSMLTRQSWTAPSIYTQPSRTQSIRHVVSRPSDSMLSWSTIYVDDADGSCRW